MRRLLLIVSLLAVAAIVAFPMVSALRDCVEECGACPDDDGCGAAASCVCCSPAPAMIAPSPPPAPTPQERCVLLAAGDESPPHSHASDILHVPRG